MEQAITIFLAGILGVFMGMTMIYVSIRITSCITDRLAARKETT